MIGHRERVNYANNFNYDVLCAEYGGMSKRARRISCRAILFFSIRDVDLSRTSMGHGVEAIIHNAT